MELAKFQGIEELNNDELTSIDGGNPALLIVAARAAWKIPAVRKWTIRGVKSVLTGAGAYLGWKGSQGLFK